MIPEHIVNHVQGPVFFGLATRDGEGRPRHATPLGALVDATRSQVTFLIASSIASGVLADLENNGLVALGCGNPVTHESYQLKGRYRVHRAASEEEQNVISLWREKVVSCLIQGGYPPPISRAVILGFVTAPATAIVFAPETIFDQTPGPRAGQLVYTADRAA